MAWLLPWMSSILFILLSLYVFQLLANALRRLPPGPRPLPIIGNLLDVAGELPHRSLARLAERYGPLMTLRIGAAVLVVVSSPAAAREALQTHGASLAGRNPPDAWSDTPHADHSVFVLPPGHQWRALRRLATEHLLSARRLDALRPLLRGSVLDLARGVSELAAAGVPVEVGRAAFAAVVELQWRAMFSAGMDAATSRELHDVGREAVAFALKANVSDFFPKIAAADLQGVRRGFTKQFRRVYQLVDEQIEMRRRSREACGAGSNQRQRDLLDAMLDMSEQGKDGGVITMNQDVMRALLTDLFLAAIDTVSHTVEWAMAELLQAPGAMRKLQEELRTVLGSKGHAEDSDVGRLPYLQAVVKETLRLHAVVPLVPYKADAAVELGGHAVPRGSIVVVNIWAIHRCAEAWAEPERFAPERFLERKEMQFMGADLEFIPFSAGRRICLGLPLAGRMLHAMLGSLLLRFDWAPAGRDGGTVDMSEKLGLTMSMATALQAIAKEVV